MKQATRISDRTRERAALICAVSASSGPASNGDRSWYWDCAIALGIRADFVAINLACDALLAANTDGPCEPGRPWPREDDALAEAMLRTGWAPS